MNTLLAWINSPEWTLLVKTLLHTLWQAGGFALLLWLALRRVATPATRYRLTLGTLAAILGTTLLTWAVLNQSATKSTAPDFASPTTPAREPSDISPVANFGEPSVIAYSTPIPKPAEETRWSGWLALAWMLGAALMLTRAGIQVAGAERLRRSCKPLDDSRITQLLTEAQRALNLTRRIRVAVTDKLTSPAVVGVIVPTLILPLTLLTTLTPEQIRFILLHELAHIRRGDYFANLFQLFIEALLFFNPAVWWISHQVRREREACCDALAIELSGAPVDYARTLLHVAETVLNPPPAAAPAFSENQSEPSSLTDRVQRLLVPGYRPALRLTWRAMLAAIVVGGTLLFLSAIGARNVVGAVSNNTTEKATEVATNAVESTVFTSSNSGTNSPSTSARQVASASGGLSLGGISILGLNNDGWLSPGEGYVLVSENGVIKTNQVGLANGNRSNNPPMLFNKVAVGSDGVIYGSNLKRGSNHFGSDFKVYSWAAPGEPQGTISKVIEWAGGSSSQMKTSRQQFALSSNTVKAGADESFPKVVDKGRKGILQRLDHIRLDNFSCDELPLMEVLYRISERVREFDPTKEGINFSIEQATVIVSGTNALASVADIPITISPNHTTAHVGSILYHITKGAASPIEYSIEDKGVVFRLKESDINSAEETFKQERGWFYSRAASALSTNSSEKATKPATNVVESTNIEKRNANSGRTKTFAREMFSSRILYDYSNDGWFAPGESGVLYGIGPESIVYGASLTPKHASSLNSKSAANRITLSNYSNSHAPVVQLGTPSQPDKESFYYRVGAGGVETNSAHTNTRYASSETFELADGNTQSVLPLPPFRKISDDASVSLKDLPVAVRALFSKPRVISISNKLDQIVFDKISFDRQSWTNVIKTLSAEVRKLDPDKRGVNLIVNPTTAATASSTNAWTAAAPEPPLVYVSVKPELTNAPLRQVLDAIVKGADKPIVYHLEEYAVVFSLKGYEIVPLEIRTFQADPNMMAQALGIIPKVIGSAGLHTTNLYLTEPFQAATNAAQIRYAVSNTFKAVGVDLNPALGKTFFYNDREGKILVRATDKELDLIEAYIAKNTTPPPQVNIKIRWVEIPQELMTPAWLNAASNAFFLPLVDPETRYNILTEQEMADVRHRIERRDGIELLSEGQVTTLTGRQAQLSVSEVKTVVTGFSTNKNDGSVEPEAKPVPLGPILDVLPTVTSDGASIRLEVIPTFTEFVGYDTNTAAQFVPTVVNGETNSAMLPLPIFRVKQVTHSAVVPDGQTLILGNFAVTEVAKQPNSEMQTTDVTRTHTNHLFILITPTIIDPVGYRAKPAPILNR